MNGWIKMQYYSVIDKEKVLLFETIWMILEEIRRDQTRQTQKKTILCDLSYMWNLRVKFIEAKSRTMITRD
jgi:hypothetical protein